MQGSPSPTPSHRSQAASAVAMGAAFVAWLILGTAPSTAQQVEFQITWVVVGEAASSDAKRSARAGKQLFMASDLLEWTLQNVKVARVEAHPTVIELDVGEQLCVSALDLRAQGADQQPVNGAPLSIAVRQDQKERLGLRRSLNDICFRPQEAGEFPVRFTSLLPAPDGTMRGAQVFIRVRDEAETADGTNAH